MISSPDDSISSWDFFHLVTVVNLTDEWRASATPRVHQQMAQQPHGMHPDPRHAPRPIAVTVSPSISVLMGKQRRLWHNESQKPLVSFSQVALTCCKKKKKEKRSESITPWWIDYSHASFREPIFQCELNLKLNLEALPPLLSDRWMEPVKRSPLESVTGGSWG